MDSAIVRALEDFGMTLVEIMPRLVALFAQHGRDGVMKMLDAELAAARKRTDVDLERKHHDDIRPIPAPNPSDNRGTK